MKREHVHYFDRLRVFAAIAVIFMHVAAGPLRGEINAAWHGLNVLTSVAFTAVPLFFMMSGYLLLTDEKTSDVGVLIKNRLCKLIIPLISWSVIAVIWNLLSSGTFSFSNFALGMVNALQSPQAVHFWYMYTLIALYVISPVLYAALKGLDKKGHALVLGICIAVSLRAMLTAVLPSSLDRLLKIDLLDKLQFFGGHLCTFVLGYYLGTCKKKFPMWALAAVSLLLAAAVIAGTYVASVQSGAFNQTFQSQSAGFEVMLAACLFLMARQIFVAPSRLCRAIPVVPLSMGIYMMHNILISVLHRFGVIEQGFWGTVGMTALVFALCYLAIKTAMSVPCVCYALTGTRFKTACASCNWVYTVKRKK